jgi:hypothetical protein
MSLIKVDARTTALIAITLLVLSAIYIRFW